MKKIKEELLSSYRIPILKQEFIFYFDNEKVDSESLIKMYKDNVLKGKYEEH